MNILQRMVTLNEFQHGVYLEPEGPEAPLLKNNNNKYNKLKNNTCFFLNRFESLYPITLHDRKVCLDNKCPRWSMRSTWLKEEVNQTRLQEQQSELVCNSFKLNKHKRYKQLVHTVAQTTIFN